MTDQCGETEIPSDDYPDVTALSLRARLAIALILFRAYCECRRLSHLEIDRYLNHLWEFIGQPDDGSAFGHWIETEPPLTQPGLGYDYPSGFESALAAAGMRESEFRQALVCTTEVLYNSMHAAADEEESRRYLLELTRIIVPLGVAWPERIPLGLPLNDRICLPTVLPAGAGSCRHASPNCLRSRRSTRLFACRTAIDVIPSSSATSVAEWPRMAVFQKAVQV